MEALVQQHIEDLCPGYRNVNNHDELCRDRLFELLYERHDLMGKFPCRSCNSACLIHFQFAVTENSDSRTSDSSVRPEPTNQTISRQNLTEYHCCFLASSIHPPSPNSGSVYESGSTPLVHMPPPIPRRNRPVLPSLASRPLAAFPVSQAGRLPHYPFRGLLSVRSRCSLRTR